MKEPTGDCCRCGQWTDTWTAMEAPTPELLREAAVKVGMPSDVLRKMDEERRFEPPDAETEVITAIRICAECAQQVGGLDVGLTMAIPTHRYDGDRSRRTEGFLGYGRDACQMMELAPDVYEQMAAGKLSLDEANRLTMRRMVDETRDAIADPRRWPRVVEAMRDRWPELVEWMGDALVERKGLDKDAVADPQRWPEVVEGMGRVLNRVEEALDEAEEGTA